MSKTVFIASWYFNPIHPWHIKYLESCKSFWDEVWVIVNNDLQAKLKTKNKMIFQDEEFRMSVISALKVVDFVMLSIDTDFSVCRSIVSMVGLIREKYGTETQIVFGKWWDRFANNIPEVEVCNNLGVVIKDGLWDKTHNSSEYRAKII